MDQSKIFKDLLVVELASVLAGPAVGMFFAELGARVIKIENKKTGGDVTRKWKLPSEDPKDEFSAYYHSTNWGKESIFLDLSDEEDRNELMDLIKKADIVISNFKSDSALKLQLDYDSLKPINPQMIYASISAYGDKNPSPGFDAMLQAETGWMSMNGEPDGSPIKMPVALIDIIAAHQLKQGILIALLKKASSHEGSFVSVSLFDASVSALANQASNYLNTNKIPQPMGSAHPNIAPYGDMFSTLDNVTIILGVGTQKQFEGLCACLGLELLIFDPRFKTNLDRLNNRGALNFKLNIAISSINFEDLKQRCLAKRVTIARINNLEEVFSKEIAQRLILVKKLADSREVKSVKTVVFKIE